MATNDADQRRAPTWRRNEHQTIHYLRRTIRSSDAGLVKIGELSKGTLILYPISGAHVTTAFNAATTNTLDIGIQGDEDLVMSAVSIGTVGFKAADENVAGYVLTQDTPVYARFNQSGTAATAGSATVIVAFIPDNENDYQA